MVCNSPKCTVRGHGVPAALVCQNTTLPTLNPSVKAVPMTGVRCSTCAASGQESWVIPGKACPFCGTPC
ncbi:hypothetical protein B2J93_680 [Marssonina coronariae]|uniref:Uncharacterized protein n=1 Tax=Diplocarpon coronariae TaxID=2795749 RepID=A0A218Z7E4_9HELO|nr:hypothetical protein B2J93_680 [Marssonina coronariae]